MAKIKKRKLSWTPSSSSQVVGYKIYWAESEALDYNSSCEMLGNVTEIILPDGVASFNPEGGPVTIGITAVDELGNESDMITLAAPYQFNVPKAPDELYLNTMDDYCISNVEPNESGEPDEEEAIEPLKSVAEPEESSVRDNRFNYRQGEEELDILTKFQLITKQARNL